LIAQNGTLAIVRAKRNDLSGKRARVSENTCRAIVHAKRNDPSSKRGRADPHAAEPRWFRLRETIAQVARWAT
jgi:hypothetical protein